MPLRDIDLSLNQTLPSEINDFLAKADHACDNFFDTGANKKIPRFLPANYEIVGKALSELKQEHPLLGDRFCEWGSGLGSATCVAALLGYEAFGVEIEGDLVKRAHDLAEDNRIPAHFLETSFLPEGFDFLQTQGGLELLIPAHSTRTSSYYPDTDWELDEVDLYYAYPGPRNKRPLSDFLRRSPAKARTCSAISAATRFALTVNSTHPTASQKTWQAGGISSCRRRLITFKVSARAWSIHTANIAYNIHYLLQLVFDHA